jgi:tetratricopeptide (TPR) repeat protein
MPKSRSNSSPPATPPSGVRTFAILVPVAAVAVVVASAFEGAWDGGRAPAPYAWADVALVHVVCAIPLALAVAAFVAPRLSAGGTLAVAVGCITVGLTPLVGDVAAEAAALLRSEPGLGIVLRAVPALALAAGLVLLVAVRVGEHHRPSPALPWRRVALLGSAGVAALFPPATYLDARCRHDLVRLGEYLEQSRLGEARTLAQGLVTLDAGRTFNGRPLPEVALALDQAVKELEARVAAPLRAYPTSRERADRARALAVLGRTDEALEVLQPVNDPAAAPEVENLRGTIHETRGEWESGLAAFRAARDAWELRPTSPARVAGALHAQTGIAYCLRKSGRYAEAEAAYREVLDLSPTADAHFLLAQFYEDAQQAQAAREHARKAIELAPDRYGPVGARLIAKLTVSQFGCLGVYDAEGFGRPHSPGAGDLKR